MNNLYGLTVRVYNEAVGEYMEVSYAVEAPGAMAAVRKGFDIARAFGLSDKTLLHLELIAEDV